MVFEFTTSEFFLSYGKLALLIPEVSKYKKSYQAVLQVVASLTINIWALRALIVQASLKIITYDHLNIFLVQATDYVQFKITELNSHGQ